MATTSASASIVRLAVAAMGTRFEVVLGGDDPVRLRAAGEAALEEVRDWHDRLSLFQRDSLLSHVNACAGERPVRVDGDTFALLEECADVHARSEGAFDPTVAPLMRAWGFHGESADRDAAVAEAFARVGWDGVHLDRAECSVRFLRPGMRLDLGGIAKGHALDAAAAVLRDAGVACALLHGGTSSVIAIGAPPCDPDRGGSGGEDAHPDEPGWRIGIGSLGGASVLLRDVALSVSAPDGRTIEHGGEILGHVLDPRTGRPAAGARLAAVVGPSARLADAWSTALLVLRERPAAIPDSLTTLIADGPADERVVDIGGARPDLFRFPPPTPHSHFPQPAGIRGSVRPHDER